MRFQLVKCNIMQITWKQMKKINAIYNLEGTVLDNVEIIKYLGITITVGSGKIARLFMLRTLNSEPVWLYL